MLIQAWRALSPPPQDIPLALCKQHCCRFDIPVVDFGSDTQNQSDGAAKSTAVHYNPAQDWYYFPEMTPDELIWF